MADIEATIDYPEYDIEEVTTTKVINYLENVKRELYELEKSFDNGKILREGIKLAIIGKPNVGKSSLMNAILKEERAIVTEFEGTTRDTIEEFVQIDGIPIKLIDTAGIRNGTDEVEKIGINKAKEIAKNCDLIIAMFDKSRVLDDEDREIIELIKDKKAIVVINKNDISVNEEYLSELKEQYEIVNISAKRKEGIEEIFKKISKMFNLNQIESDSGIVVTNIRHKNAIRKSSESICSAIDSAKSNMPIDIISVYIKEGLEYLGEIIGENVTDDILKEIFSKFCLGK